MRRAGQTDEMAAAAFLRSDEAGKFFGLVDAAWAISQAEDDS